MDLPDLMELQTIVDYAQEQGANYADLRADDTLTTGFQVQNGAIKSLRTNRELGFGLRVLVDGAWGFTTSINFSAIKGEIAGLIRLTRSSAKHNSSKIEIMDLPSINEAVVWAPKKPFDSMAIEDKIAFVMDANSRPTTSSPHIASVNNSFTERTQTRQFVNSEQRQIQYSLTRCNFGAYLVGKMNDLTVERSRSLGGIGGLETVPFDKGLEIIEEETKTVLALLDAKACPSGSMPVVLNFDLAYTLAHEAFGHLCEGDSVIKGDSILEGRLGSQVASACTTIIDDPTELEPDGRPAFGSFPYDDEGVKAAPVVLVEEGNLISFMHNRESAKKLAQSLTANGRAESALRIPQVRMTNTHVKPGDASQEELLEGIPHGLYLVDSKGGQTTGQGTFHVGVQLAYEIKNGRLGELYRGTAIGGLTLDTLAQISLIGREMGYDIGACGKGEPTQTVFTGSNSPEIRVEKIGIGG